MQPVIFMILGLSLTSLVRSECPDIEDEPVMYPYDETLFLCVDVYQGPGDYDAIQACNTCEEDGFGQVYRENGYEHSSEEGQYTPMGSIIIMPGCTFYGFSERNYEGEVRQYDGGQVVPFVEDFGAYSELCGHDVYGFHSYKCQCVQELIECLPTDEFENVIICDNRDNAFTIDCTFTQTVGTAYTEENVEAKSVSADVSAAIEAGLMNLYSTELGQSTDTDYDWSLSNTETFSETVSSSVSFRVPPGFMTSVDQVVGYCDGNLSLPNEFRFTTESADGERGVKFYSNGINGKLVEVHHKNKVNLDTKDMKEALQIKKTK